MRILQVAHYFLPKHIGGVENYTYNLSKELQKEHEVYVYCREDGNFDKKYYEIDEEYRGLKLKRVYYNIPLTAETNYKNELIEKQFSFFLDKIKPDIVHFQHLERLSVTLIAAAKEKGVPVVLTLHDYWFICPLIQLLKNGDTPCPAPYSSQKCVDCLKTWFQTNRIIPLGRKTANDKLDIINKRTQLMKEMLSKADRIIAPSEFLKGRFIDYGIPTEKITYLEYGIDTSKFLNFKKVTSSKVRFGFVGTIIKHKGLHLLVDAFRRLKDPEAELKIFGRGYDDYFHKILRSINSDKRIEYCGSFDNKDTASAFSQFDVLVIPSIWYENSPFVIKEAFFNGTPVIGSNIGAIPGKIKHLETGILFDLSQKDSLYNTLKLIMDNKPLIRQLAANIGPVKNISQQVDELNALYKSINKASPAKKQPEPFFCRLKELKEKTYSQKLEDLKAYNLYLANKALQKKAIYVNSMPVNMNIETTLKCNLQCLMCVRQYTPQEFFLRPSMMKLELFQRIAKQSFPYLQRVSPSEIGEPLLSENLFEILDTVARYSVRLEMVTNGTLLDNEKLILKLLDVLDALSISLDAVHPVTYASIRRGGDLTRVIKNIKLFNELKKRVKSRSSLALCFAAMKKNIAELPQFIKLAKSLEADAVVVQHLTVFNDRLKDESLIYHKEIADKYFYLASQEAKNLGIRLDIPGYGLGKEDITSQAEEKQFSSTLLRKRTGILKIADNYNCKFLWTKTFINADGIVYPCCGNSPDRPAMGNILEQPLAKIWNNSLYMRMRRSFTTGKLFNCCKNCFMLPIELNKDEARYFIKI